MADQVTVQYQGADGVTKEAVIEVPDASTVDQPGLQQYLMDHEQTQAQPAAQERHFPSWVEKLGIKPRQYGEQYPSYITQPGGPLSAPSEIRNDPAKLKAWWDGQMQRTMKQTGAALPILATGGTAAPLMAGLGALFNYNTVKTPTDLGTAAAMTAVAPASEALKVGSRAANTALGAAKGYGLFEAGTRLHDAMDGKQQAPLNPADKSPSDVFWQGLSTLLGGAGGYATGNQPAPSARKVLRDAYDQFSKKLEEHQASRVPILQQIESTTQAHADSTQNLARQEKTLSFAAQLIQQKMKKLEDLKARLVDPKFNKGAQANIQKAIERTSDEVLDLQHQAQGLPANPMQELQKLDQSRQDVSSRSSMLDTLKSQLAENKKGEASMLELAPPKPRNETMTKVQKMLEAHLPTAVAGGAMYELSGAMQINPVAGAVAGLITKGLIDTKRGQQLLRLLAPQLAKPGTSLMQPGLANQARAE